MPAENHQEACKLCSQKVAINGFTLVLAGKEYKFCCAGCLCIFRLLYSEKQHNNYPPNINKES